MSAFWRMVTCDPVSPGLSVCDGRTAVGPGGARALVFRQDPHFLGFFVDAAVDATLRLGRRLGLVEPVVVPRVVVLLSLHGRDRTVFAGLPTSHITSGGP